MLRLTLTILAAATTMACSQTNLTPTKATQEATRVSGPGEENITTPLRTNRLPLINRNATNIPIQFIEIMERESPGSSTNFSPSQFSDRRTNPASIRMREVLQQSKPLPDHIRSDDTNFLQKLQEWKRTNSAAKPKPAEK